MLSQAEQSAAFSRPAWPDYYAFANSQDLGYATLRLTVGNTAVNISTAGFQGWISDKYSFNIAGPLGANSNYMVGVYNNASYNNYFGFNLSRLGSSATVTSATLILNSGLISEKVNYSLFSATQWMSQLEAGSSPNAALYQELETGPELDPTVLSPNTTDPTKPLTFVLDPSGVSDINTAIRNGAMMFALSGHADLASGLLSSSVPEPSPWILMLAGFAGLGVAARRAVRRRAGHAG